MRNEQNFHWNCVLSLKLSAHAAQEPSKKPLSKAVTSASCPGSICPFAQISAVIGINQRTTMGPSQLLPMQLLRMVSRACKTQIGTTLPALETARYVLPP